jgi:O-methyltransferase involved in polyketide biosynthesis
MDRAFAETLAVDRLVAAWHELRPGSPVLEIGAGLSTRFARVSALDARFITVDEPAVAELRRELFDGDYEALWQLSGHLEKADWLTRVLAPKRPVCVVLEGVLSALHPTDALALLDNLATQLRPSSRIIATFSERTQITPAQGGCLRLACGASSVCYPGLRTHSVSSSLVVAEAS